MTAERYRVSVFGVWHEISTEALLPYWFRRFVGDWSHKLNIGIEVHEIYFTFKYCFIVTELRSSSADENLLLF